MTKTNFLACLILLLATPVFSQKKLQKAGEISPENLEKLKLKEDTIGVLAFAVLNDSLETERFAACRVLIKTLVAALKIENSFNYTFPQIKSISVLAPPDSSFRIFTWQLFVNDSTYRYFGAIQLNNSDLQLFSLSDRSDEMTTLPTHEALPPEKWYGSIYYTLRQFDTKKDGRKYLLIGFDAFEFFEKRKVIDVLSFGNDGRPIFGAPVFDREPIEGEIPGLDEYRIILEYTSEAAVRCNWDEEYQKVLYDHLIPTPSRFGGGTTNVPDGSVEGLELKKGRWKHISKVFNDSQKEAPRPEPILDQRKNQNILGKEKKKIGW